MTLADEQNDRTTPDVIGRALVVAASAHRGQTRKGCDVPYITHPVEVSRVLREHGLDESHETLHAAALLHDVVEDTPVTFDDLRTEFPSDVIAWVEVASEVKQDASGQKLPWKVRKTEHLDRLNTAPWEVAAIVLADKIHNLRDITADPREASYWAIFSASPLELIWYYDAVVAACLRQGRTDSLAKTASELVARMKRMIGGQ